MIYYCSAPAQGSPGEHFLVKRTPRINKVFVVVVFLKLYILFKTTCIHIYEQQLPGSSQYKC